MPFELILNFWSTVYRLWSQLSQAAGAPA